MKIKYYLLMLLLIASMAIFSERTFAFDFKFSSNETVLLEDEFDSRGKWQLSSKLRLNSGYLISDGDYQAASLNLVDLGISPLDLSNGAINLYWRGIFPKDATKPRNSYVIALEYADNLPFCWNGKIGQDVEMVIKEDASPCPTGFSQVKDDGELKAWIRPQEPAIPGLTRLFVDPDFIPGIQPEERNSSEFPYILLDGKPNSQTEYRMRVEEKNRQVEVELFFLKDDKWESLGKPLVVEASQWKYVIGQKETRKTDYLYGIEENLTFESINVILRRDQKKQPTKIDAIALTQEKIFDRNSVSEPKQPAYLP